MSLTLYYHPLASYCHKVLIALYELGLDFSARLVDFGDERSTAELSAAWPLQKIPVLRDDGRDQTIPETSIIIEYLCHHAHQQHQLLPQDAADSLQVRLWDRFFDQYVHAPMQKIVADALRPAHAKDPFGVEQARSELQQAYSLLDRRFQLNEWASGGGFSMADCAAWPALFYAGILVPFADQKPHLDAYFSRLCARRSVVRVLREARPYFHLFPFREAIPQNFMSDATHS